MKLCINHQPGSYSDRWIDYCQRNGIPFKIINCRDTDIIDQLEDGSGLMWHWDLTDFRAALFARQLTILFEKKGIKVFPDVNTSWHYDDKIGQKYLLEAINAPMVKTYVFYTKKDALKWAETVSFPKVFKLRCGAGSSNVRLAKSKNHAKKLIRRAFGKGYKPIDPIGRVKERFWILKRDRNLKALKLVAGGFARLMLPNEKENFSPKEKGYIYFQEFIAHNSYDTRLVVIGNRCFGLRRYCRPGDFRASGSGLLDYNPDSIDIRMVEIAHETAVKLRSQSMAFDFILDESVPKIIEISYCHPIDFLDKCPGYWDRDLNWHEGSSLAQEFILDDFVQSLNLFSEKTKLPETKSTIEMNMPDSEKIVLID